MARDLAAARQQIEAHSAEIAKVRQGGEAVARQLWQALEEERQRAIAVRRAAARQEIKARSALAAAAASEAAEFRQAGQQLRGSCDRPCRRNASEGPR